MPIVSLNMSSETTATSAKAKKDTFICPICDNIIKEAVGKRQGQDAIECSGSCATWLHKHCAGLSKEAFLAANKSDKPFYCPQCRLNIQELEINSLRDIVKDLSSELTALKRTIDLTRLPSAYSSDNQGDGTTSYASVTRGPQPSGSTNSAESASSKAFSSSPDTERKFNLIIQGIDECPRGTRIIARQSQDLEKISETLSSVVGSIDSSSIRDLYRIGKYDPNSNRPRPVLAKLIRATDVSAILSKKTTLPSHVFVRPDRTKEERLRYQSLMKERWILIQAGVERRDIKIRTDSIYVNNVLHGKLDSSNNYVKSTTVSDSDSVSPSTPLHSQQSTPAQDTLITIPLTSTQVTLPDVSPSTSPQIIIPEVSPSVREDATS